MFKTFVKIARRGGVRGGVLGRGLETVVGVNAQQRLNGRAGLLMANSAISWPACWAKWPALNPAPGCRYRSRCNLTVVVRFV